MPKTPATAPTVNHQHDYSTVNLGNNRRLTVSYRGTRASGAVPRHLFDLWDGCVGRRDPASLARIGITDLSGVLNGRIVEAFAKAVPSLWPEWNVPPRIPSLRSTVHANFGGRRGMDEGVVEAVRGTMITVRFQREGLVRIPADMLED